MRHAGRSRRGVAGIVAAVLLFAMLFTVGTGYFLFMAQSDNQYAQALVTAATKMQNSLGETMTVTTLLLSNGDLGFYVNNTSSQAVNMTVALVLSSTGTMLDCNGVGLPAGAGCGNTTPALWTIVNVGKGSAEIDTGYVYVAPNVDTIKVITARGNAFSATYPPTTIQNSVQANTAQSLTVDPITFKWTTLQASPSSVVQSKYTSNCAQQSCGLQYNSQVAAGNTLVYALGWYALNPPATPTDTLGSTWTLGVSNSMTYTYTPALVNKAFNPNCGASTCGNSFTVSNSGDTLVFGLGWLNQSPPTTPTDTFGDTFTLGASKSVVVNPPSPSLRYSAYNANCAQANCALGFSSNQVNQGDTVVYGLGWYGPDPYVPVTVNYCPAPAISLVQHGPAQYQASSSTLVMPFTNNQIVQNGDLVVVTFNDQQNVGVSSVSGFGVSSWSSAVSKNSNGGGVAYMYYGISGGGANSYTGTVTFNNNDRAAGSAAEFSGIASSSIIDGTPGSNSGTGTSPSTGSTTTTNARDLLMAVEADSQGYGVNNPTNGFTTLEQQGTFFEYANAYNIVSSTGTYSAGWTIPQSANWAGIIAAFKAASSGSGCGSSAALDGSAGGISGTNTATSSPNLTTTNANDVIILMTGTSSSSTHVTSVSDGASLAWSHRTGGTETGSPSVEEEEWYAISNSVLTNDQVTVHWSAAGDNAFAVFGISGANTITPFDANGALPGVNTGSGTPGPSPSVTVSTSSVGDFVFGMVANEHTSASVCHTETVASGFTDIYPTCQQGTSTTQNVDEEYQTESSTVTNLAVGMTTSSGGSNQWAMIGDAVQSASLPANFQEMVTWNPSSASYKSYEAADLGNVRFCADAGCATPLYGWLESCGGAACTPNASTATAWVKLSSAIPPGGSATIYMMFYPTTVEFDGNYWGEAPTLSGTYAQYDNGANVFSFYDNFAGSTLNSANWQTKLYGGGTVTVNNGVTLSATSTSYNPMLVSKSTYSPSVEDASLALTSQQTSASTPTIFFATTLPTTSGGDYGYQTIYRYDWYKQGGDFRIVQDTSGSPTGGPTVSYSLPSSYNVWTATWSSTGDESFAFNYNTQLTWTDNGINYGSAYIGAGATQGGSVTMNWLRLRGAPPGGTMPSATFGSVTGGNPLQSISDTQGNTFVLGASYWTVSGSSTYFSYIWYTTAKSTGTDTVTAAFNHSLTGTESAYDIQGYSTTGVTTSTKSGAGTSLSVTSFSPSSNSFVIGNAETTTSTSSFTAGTNYALVSSSCSSAYGCSEYWGTSSGAQTVPLYVGTSTAWVESAIAFPVMTTNTYYSYIWYATAGNTGSDTISATFSQSVTGSVSEYEFSGLTTAGLLSSTGSSAAVGSSATVSPSLSPSAGSTVVGNVETSSTTVSAGSGYTLVGTCSSVYGCGEYENGVGSSTTVALGLNPSASWVEAALAFAPATLNYYSYIWYAAAASAGADTVSATFSQTPTGSVAIYELNGYSMAGVTSSTGSSSTGTTSASVTSFTPGLSAVVIALTEGATTTFTAGSGYGLTGTCSSVHGCAESDTGVSSATTAPMTLNPSAPWVESAIGFPASPAVQSGIQVGGYPADGIPVSKNLAWRVQFTNQDAAGRSVTLWPKSLAAIETIMAETVEVTPFFIVNGIASDGSGLIAYSQPFITIPYKATVTVYFGATAPLGTGTDNVDQTEIAPFTAFFALEGIYSDNELFSLTVPYPAGMVTQGNAKSVPTAGATGSQVTISCTSPCYFNPSSQSYVGWLDSTGHMTVVTTFTTNSNGNIPSGVTFNVPSGTPGTYYTIVVSDYVNTVYLTFQHT